MNRKQFFTSLILGGIVLPTLPRKLILTGGWFEGGVYKANALRNKATSIDVALANFSKAWRDFNTRQRPPPFDFMGSRQQCDAYERLLEMTQQMMTR